MHISLKEVQDNWNRVFGELFKKSGLTQQALADELNAENGTRFSQKDVSHWLSVGSAIIQGGKQRMIGLPKYETMAMIANHFGVGVGYLTGETDFRTFDLERASSFTGLSESALLRITRLTGSDSVPFGRNGGGPLAYMGPALSEFISSDRFMEFASTLVSLYTSSKGLGNLPTFKNEEYARDYLSDLREEVEHEEFRAYRAFVRLMDDIYESPRMDDFVIDEDCYDIPVEEGFRD